MRLKCRRSTTQYNQQKAQIDALTADLKAALKQVQELSTKAIGGPVHTGTA